jgi:hypothetical protein
MMIQSMKLIDGWSCFIHRGPVDDRFFDAFNRAGLCDCVEAKPDARVFVSVELYYLLVQQSRLNVKLIHILDIQTQADKSIKCSE